MAVQIQTRRSSTLNDRPFPIRLGAGELALNNHSTSPGLFFADNVASPSTGLIKVGPTHVGSTQPNNAPTGFTSFSKGESWLDTSSTELFRVHDGTNWQYAKAVASTTNTGFPSNPVNGQLHFIESTTTLHIYRTSIGGWTAIN